MNQNVTTTDLKDTICSNCHCKDQQFLHHVWVEDRDLKFCTSCVLFTHKLSFCPTCFGDLEFVSKNELIRCRKCSSYSHPHCYSVDGTPSAVPACSTCINPERLIFELEEYKVKGTEEWCKGINEEAARLLFTAARIVNMSVFKTHDGAAYSARAQVEEAVLYKKRATTSVERCLKVKESNSPPSAHEPSTDGKEDGRVTGSLQMLAIKGAASEPQSGRVAKMIHLSEKYPSKNASI